MKSLLPSFAVVACSALALSTIPGLAETPAPTPAPKKFSMANLGGKSFKAENLENAKFSKVNLAKANFEGAKLKGARFKQVRLTHADFTGATFGEDTWFLECTLNAANLSGVDFKGADFDRVNLRGANLKNTKGWGDISDSTFSDADIRGADLSKAKGDLETVQWSGAIYDDATKFPAGLKPEEIGATRRTKPE